MALSSWVTVRFVLLNRTLAATEGMVFKKATKYKSRRMRSIFHLATDKVAPPRRDMVRTEKKGTNLEDV